MINQLEERIKIIGSFKSTHYWKDESAEKQYKVLKWLGISNLIIGVLLLLLIIFISAKVVLKFEPNNLGWEKTGLLVFVVMSANYRNPSLFIEFMLKNHLKKIRNVNNEFSKASNAELQLSICKFNSKLKRLYIVGIPLILIMIGAILQHTEMNPFWDIFAYIILIFSVFMLAKIYSDITTIRKNLIEFEKVNI